MIRPKRNSRSSNHSHECHQCISPPERSASGRRLSLPMSLLQTPHVPGPAVGTPSFGAVARVRPVDHPFTEEPGDMSGDQYVPTSPSIPARESTEYMSEKPGQTVTRRATAHSPTLSPLPPPAMEGDGGGGKGPGGRERGSTSSSSSVPPDEKPYPDQETHHVPPDMEAVPGTKEDPRGSRARHGAGERVRAVHIPSALSAGVLDATTYADFQTFASNQTGNAIVLTLAAVGAARALVLLTGVSFAGFIAGAFLMGHLGNFLGPRRRYWLLITIFWQCCLLIICAVFVSPHGPPGTRVGAKNQWAVLFLFAHMSGAQVVMARQSACAELPTAPMTSSLVDFVADQYLFRSWGNPKAGPRNRRVMYMVAMIGGSFLGAILHRWTASWVVIMVAVLLKALSGVMVCFASPEN
ncbi:hypothetical protein A1Q2_07251 [Trichosporon asahii var. asahii CBS 8904]|uniref:DUF1275 domain protein n=1 Tax=Trichosporon asahii var. asahii (strain CBS 8904) TaxID=1220162 RepID=K1VNJ4_TRIAC|nr:hypothetical protein A1Q2_07251 [Trichosporon asahii var. asahii CBS 8904]